MHRRLWIYCGFFGVALLSFAASAFLPVESEKFRDWLAFPGLGAMVTAVITLLRDHDAHLRQVSLQERANGFHVAAQSHMAKQVFDKHMAFAEDYAAAVLAVAQVLWREGPSSHVMDITALTDVRNKHRLWVPDQLASKLDQFQISLVRIGAGMNVWNNTRDHSGLAPDHLERIYQEFDAITGLDSSRHHGETGGNRSYNHILAGLQSLLNVDALTALRDEAIQSAMPAQRRS